MPYKTGATVTRKGQITLPAELRTRWALKPGDRIGLSLESDGRVIMTKHPRRSILESREELAPLSLGRPLTQSDVDRAVAEAMATQELRVGGRRP
jgi:AbrB family looped-hinge helix DNA binding protein